jgi:hypothetical protein
VTENQPASQHQDEARELQRTARRGADRGGGRDEVPGFVLRGQGWLHGWFSNQSRLVLGLVVLTLAVVVAIVLSSSKILRIAIEDLSALALVGLFLVNWLGNGGILVPIPGARFIGLLMVFQQAVLVPSWEVFLVAGAAMGLGQLSYYVAGARTAGSYAEGDDAGAERLATDTGMLDTEHEEFTPGADLQEDLVSTIADVRVSETDEGAGVDDAATGHVAPAEPSGLRKRFSSSLRRTQKRAQPILDQRGAWGMFLLCFAPTPMGTAAAYLGGLMAFGFRRFIVSSFAAKFLLTGVIVVLALTFSDAARAVALPDIELPQFELPDFDIGLFELPDFGPDATPSAAPAASIDPAG